MTLDRLNGIIIWGNHPIIFIQIKITISNDTQSQMDTPP